MGLGIFNSGEFSFTVAANFTMTNTLRDNWKTRFTAASKMLFNTTRGQFYFKEISFVDETLGLGEADFILIDGEGRSNADLGGFGKPGQATRIFSKENRIVSAEDEKRIAVTLLHEFFHLAFDIVDEYVGTPFEEYIDPDGTFDIPGPYYSIPIMNSITEDRDLVHFVYLKFLEGDKHIYEKRLVLTYDINRIIPNSPFVRNPLDSVDREAILVADEFRNTDGNPQSIGCGLSKKHCYMEKFDTAETTELCKADNHGETASHSYHYELHGGDSCWELIKQKAIEEWDYLVTIPNYDDNRNSPDHIEPDFPIPDFKVLDNKYRVALSLDRSGSMSENEKIEGVKFAIEPFMYMFTYDENPRISVNLFNHEVEMVQTLGLYSTLNISQIVNTVKSVTPSSATNILEGLRQAHAQIRLTPGRGVRESIFLLTDGIHNYPQRSSVDEIIEELVEDRIRVFALCLGSDEDIDYATMERLALQTGGDIYQVTEEDMGSTNITSKILAAKFAMYNSLVADDEGTINYTPHANSPIISQQTFSSLNKREQIGRLKKAVKVQKLKDLVSKRRYTNSESIPILVEKTAEELSFSINFPIKEEYEIYLLTPKDELFDFNSNSNSQFFHSDTTILAQVQKPEPGVWRAIIVKLSHGRSSKYKYSAGIRNRRISVEAETTKNAALGSPIELSTRALWIDSLSGLVVKAELKNPSGESTSIILTDPDELGDYTAVFVPREEGRYTGYITVQSSGRISLANPFHRLTHPFDAKEKEISMHSEAEQFKRIIPIYFDVGQRKEPKDKDKVAAPSPGRRKIIGPIRRNINSPIGTDKLTF